MNHSSQRFNWPGLRRSRLAAFDVIIEGNTSFWIIKVHPSTSGIPNRVIETNKDKNNPPVWLWLYCDMIPSQQDPTCPGEHSEQTLVGSITTDGGWDRGDFVVTQADVNATDWLFVNAGLDSGGRLPGMIGYEAQNVVGSKEQPPGQAILAHSQFKSHYSTSQIIDPPYPYADMSLYPASSGALVLSTGSTDWSFGLDIFNTTDFPDTRYRRAHPAVAQITRNVLHRFGDGRDPGKLTSPAYAVTLVSSQGGQVCVHYTRPAGRSQIPDRDFIALHRVMTDEDLLVSYRSDQCNRLDADESNCCVSTPPSGVYTGDYVTLDKTWTPDPAKPPFRTIWRAAKSLEITVP